MVEYWADEPSLAQGKENIHELAHSIRLKLKPFLSNSGRSGGEPEGQ